MRLPSDADASGRDFRGSELDYLKQVLDSGTLNCTKGTQVKAFERDFAALYGTASCRAVTSGTAAMHCAVAALDLSPGDEVITTTVTDMGAITPILYEQGVPIFADVDPDTLNVTPETIRARITPRTKGIIATHLFGNPCDMEGIMAVAREHGIVVIEDCAQAYLATQNGRLLGTIGDIGAFSMQQGKHMTTGEGGMVISNDPKLARRMVLFSDKAWGYGDANPDHYFMAINYRMTELQGAVARGQLEKVRSVVERRQKTAAQMDRLLANVPGILIPKPLPGCTHVYWKYTLMVDADVIPGGTDALAKQLKEDSGIFTVPRYVRKPAFECQVLNEDRTYQWCGSKPSPHRDDYPGTISGLDRVLVLPWNEHYTGEHVEFIAANIRRAVDTLCMRSHRAAA
ncbi:MAG: DegT/DnrJ/EryC1/StrS family aminotransferase [Bryobacteraceae bacterium]